jgi:carnitine O-acetyltransferase
LFFKDRDVWADVYTQLSQKSTKNRKNFQQIHNSLFVLCLDNEGEKSGSVDQRQDAKSVAASQILHGNKEFTANRFFDKTIQAIFGDNGVWGVCFEHSVAEAVPHALMNDFIYSYITSTKSETVNVDFVESEDEIKNRYRELKFDLPEKVEEQIVKSTYSVHK